MKSFFFHSGPSLLLPSLGLLVMRVGFGLYLALGHGLSKLQNFSELKEGFPVPAPIGFLSSQMSLSLAIAVELGAAFLIVAGLLTRPAALLVAITMGLAAFQIHGAHPWVAQSGPSKELAMMYFLPAVALLLMGAGRFSLDKVFGGAGRRF